jgi:hypothetical protein
MPQWDVTVAFEGPSSATDNAAVRFSGTGGSTSQNSGLIVSDCSSATFSSGGLNIASGDAFSIACASVLNATTLGTLVVNSSLTGVGALTTGGSIAAGFGNIDNGTSNITSGGIWSVDIDSASTINACGGGIGAVGSITLGVGADAGLYVKCDDLYIENKTSNNDLVFRVNDAGVFTEVARIVGSVRAMKFSEITDPGDPGGGAGGYLYAKADGKPYWRSNEIAETALDAAGVGLGLVIALS